MNQQQPQPNYKFYATLLDAFSWYQQSESDNSEQEFIDKINRVPVTDEKALERMNKGTALNDLVDEQLKSTTLSMNGMLQKNGFEFDVYVVSELSNYLTGSVPQHYTETTISIDGKSVLLYGYIDYVRQEKCIDLKTTSSYDLGKYKGSMQRHLYPVSLFAEGVIVDEFEFLVTDFKSVFKETYPVSFEESKSILVEQCRLLIDFLESKKHLITDKKIFAQE